MKYFGFIILPPSVAYTSMPQLWRSKTLNDWYMLMQGLVIDKSLMTCFKCFKSLCTVYFNYSFPLQGQNGSVEKGWLIGMLCKLPVRSNDVTSHYYVWHHLLVHTVRFKSMNPRYNIHMYWTIFCLPTIRLDQNIFEKTLI